MRHRTFTAWHAMNDQILTESSAIRKLAINTVPGIQAADTQHFLQADFWPVWLCLVQLPYCPSLGNIATVISGFVKIEPSCLPPSLYLNTQVFIRPLQARFRL